MSEEKKYRNFTAADIEKYHKGLLSPKEMNELEKAAMEDPLLADALEGYGTVSINVSADIEELQKKLEERVSGAKLVKITPPLSVSRLLKVAAVIVLVAGAAFLVYQLGFKREDQSLVQQPEIKKQEIPTVQDSVKPTTTEVQTETTSIKNGSVAGNTKEETKQLKETVNFKIDKGKNRSSDSLNVTSGVSAFQKEAAPAKSEDNVAKIKAEVRRDDNNRQMQIKDTSLSGLIGVEKQNADNSAGAKISPGDLTRGKNPNPPTNYFRGRVVDANNNALPFANITNNRDDVGTYADAKGNFTLISPDSILNVRVYSVGFVTNNNVQLKNNVASNQVVMYEDKNEPAVVLGKRPANFKVSQEKNTTVEEPEPADGWGYYDIYLANNIKIPDDIKSKKNIGEVAVSFEVNENGEPINIKIERSLCKRCDDEAIRLVKQGPKWKYKRKQSRVTVKVPFTHY